MPSPSSRTASRTASRAPGRRLAALTATALVPVVAVLALLPASPPAAADPPAPFAPRLVEVRTPTAADVARVEALGLDVADPVGRRRLAVVVHTRGEQRALAALGLTTTTLVPDLVAREAERAEADAAYAARVTRSPLPSGRTTYRTLDDYDRDMRALARDHAGTVRTFTLRRPTLDGRTVRAVEVAGHVRRKADGRPTFLVLGLHHAREWPSAEHTMELAIKLARGYGRDARITRLLDRVRVVLVPVVNADGFDLSRTSGGLADLNVLNPLDPSGTVVPTLTQVVTPGMAYLRKNCRLVDGLDTPDGTCAAQLTTPAGFSLGVDLNRNYGAWWSGPGSAGTLPSVTAFHAGLVDPRYHGASAFSEPETRNVRDLVLSRAVTGLVTNHTFGDLVLRPFSGAPSHVSDAGRRVGLARDERAMARLGDRLAEHNGYTSQRSYQLYDGMGTTEDWAYAATGAFGYTFEIGATEFHPPFEEVVAHYTGRGRSQAAGGNRAAYLDALAHAAAASKHSRLKVRATPGARLVVRRDASTPTWDGSSAATYRVAATVPRSGRLTWHLNPSTRPLEAREPYVLTCEVDGEVRQRARVFLGRGAVRAVSLRRC
ncbi:MAG: carboxypeptidase [Nocardioides sp.]|nr:carboxypeptidase [Nocardioides sp.]